MVSCGYPEKLNNITDITQADSYHTTSGSGALIVNNINTFGFSSAEHIFAISHYGVNETLITINASTSFILTDITTGSILAGELLYLDRVKYKSTGEAIHSGFGYKFTAPNLAENIIFNQIDVTPWVIYQEGSYFDIATLKTFTSPPVGDFHFSGTNGNDYYTFDSTSKNIYALSRNNIQDHIINETALTTTVNNLPRNNYCLIFRSRNLGYGYLTPQNIYTDNGHYLYSAFIHYYPNGETHF